VSIKAAWQEWLDGFTEYGSMELIYAVYPSPYFLWLEESHSNVPKQSVLKVS
jgi:hypothetical protein